MKSTLIALALGVALVAPAQAGEIERAYERAGYLEKAGLPEA